jgi:hypothetical protein
MNDDNRALKDFMAAYFHQDWDFDAESPTEVVSQYLRDTASSPELVSVARALRVLVNGSEDDEALTRRLFSEFGCYFDPRGSGQPTRGWLRSLADQVEDEVRRRA